MLLLLLRGRVWGVWGGGFVVVGVYVHFFFAAFVLLVGVERLADHSPFDLFCTLLLSTYFGVRGGCCVVVVVVVVVVIVVVVEYARTIIIIITGSGDMRAVPPTLLVVNNLRPTHWGLPEVLSAVQSKGVDC